MTLKNLSFFTNKLFKTYMRQLCVSRIVLKRRIKPNIPMGVLVIGANNNVGRISALLFKQQKIFKNLILYDNEDTSCIAADLKRINTTPQISHYSGIKNLESAIIDVPIVYICGGIQTIPGISENDLFDKNVSWVRQAITYCAEFNPDANVVINVPPITYLVPLAVEEFRKNAINAEKRVFGVTRTLLSRANVIAGCSDSYIVGGCHTRTFIPVVSHSSTGKKSDNDCITHKIQDAEETVLRQKIRESNCTGCFLSTAYNGAQFTTLLANALVGKSDVKECAFVKQDQPMEEYAKYFSCLVQLDKSGIKSCHIPKMSQNEKIRLKKVMNEIRHKIYLGSSYVTGDEMIVVRIPQTTEKKLKPPPEESKKAKEKEKKPVCEKIKSPKQIKVPVFN